MTPFFFLEYFAYFQVCRYVQVQSEVVKKKKKKRGHNMSRVSYTKTLSLYFINGNILANIKYSNHVESNSKTNKTLFGKKEHLTSQVIIHSF